jgi:hypothetical protein
MGESLRLLCGFQEARKRVRRRLSRKLTEGAPNLQDVELHKEKVEPKI